MSDKKALVDFLAAAKQQQAIEERVRQDGQNTRATLEEKMFVDLGGGAAIRVQEPNDMHRILAHLLHYTKTEVQSILTLLNNLPADDEGCCFIVKHSVFHGTRLIVKFEVYYMRPDAVKDFNTNASIAGAQNAFHIELSKTKGFFNSEIEITFLDYSRLSSNGFAISATRTHPADSQDLRALIGSCVARIAPHRVADVIAAIEQPLVSTSSTIQPAATQHMKRDAQRFKLPLARKPPS